MANGVAVRFTICADRWDGVGVNDFNGLEIISMAEKRQEMHSEPTRHLCCPGCGARGGYRLGDGRKKCRRCGKKYSPRLLQSRLPAKTLKQIALYFWMAAPVATVSSELRLNPKTVGRHYDLMRQGISESAKTDPPPVVQDDGGGAPVWKGGGGSNLVLLVGPRDTRVTAVCPVRTEEGYSLRASYDSVGYRWHFSEKSKFPAPMLETACHVYLADEGIRLPTKRWLGELELLARLACRSCRLRRCRSMDSPPGLAEEIAFRFNHRSDPGVTAVLYGWLSARPPCADSVAGEP